MRRSLFTVGILACIITLVAAWSKEDQEIFRLRDEVEASEGVGVTFYDFLGITPSANQEDINQAYKKKGRTLHPDKVKRQFVADKERGKGKGKTGKNKKPGVHVSKGPSQAEIDATIKVASDRFARLGVVTTILRGAGRERYDHFLSNGFPKWKGTGYYYARFRPGLGSVLLGLFIFVGGGGHWLALYMSWKRQQEFVGRYIKFARHAAWGDTLNIPGLEGTSTPPVAAHDDEDGSMQPMNRRQRRMQEKDNKKEKPDRKLKVKAAKNSPAGTPTDSNGPRKRVVAENGKILVVDSVGNVYLEQQDADGDIQQFLLDPNELVKPTIRDTALCRLPIWAFNLTAGRFLRKKSNEAESDVEEEDNVEGAASSSSGPEDFEVLDEVKTTAQNGNGKAVRRKKSTKGR